MKNYNKTGTKKSLLPAYSTDKFRIKTVNPWTQTYEIERIDNDKRAHRSRLRVHHRIVKRLGGKELSEELKDEMQEKGPDGNSEKMINQENETDGDRDVGSNTDDTRNRTLSEKTINRYNLRKRK